MANIYRIGDLTAPINCLILDLDTIDSIKRLPNRSVSDIIIDDSQIKIKHLKQICKKLK